MDGLNQAARKDATGAETRIRRHDTTAPDIAPLIHTVLTRGQRRMARIRAHRAERFCRVPCEAWDRAMAAAKAARVPQAPSR